MDKSNIPCCYSHMFRLEFQVIYIMKLLMKLMNFKIKSLMRSK